ncbi:MAG: hypothetical protein RLN88_00665 [Ekhidna sp.]
MTELISEKNIDKPPLFKKWRYLYLFVAAWLAVLILLFHLFSSTY